MGRWTRRLAPLLVELASVRDVDAVLDVGSGTGSLALDIAAAFRSARVSSIDRSADYVRSAQERAAGARVQFQVGDAQRLGMPDRSFDKALAPLVLNFIPDPAQALREMVRVTRPGGPMPCTLKPSLFGAGSSFPRSGVGGARLERVTR